MNFNETLCPKCGADIYEDITGVTGFDDCDDEGVYVYKHFKCHECGTEGTVTYFATISTIEED